MLKVDVTRASLTHALKKLKYFRGFFFFLISFLVCHEKLVPLHNLVKSELFYLLESWRYEEKQDHMSKPWPGDLGFGLGWS